MNAYPMAPQSIKACVGILLGEFLFIVQLITRWLSSNSFSFNSMLTLLKDIRETRKTVDGGCSRSTEVLSSLDGASSLNHRHLLRCGRRRQRRRRDCGHAEPMCPRRRGAGGGGHLGNRGPHGQCLRSIG